MKARLQRVIGYLTATVAVLLGWAAISLIIDNPALPLPTTAVQQFIALFPEMLPHIGISFYRIVISMVLGTIAGTILGLIIGRSTKLDAVGAPLLYVLYPVPKIVFVPVLMVLLGLGNAPAIVLISTVIFFQTVVTARAAAKSISPDLVASVRSLGASKLDVARHVVFPSALPSIFTALRISAGTAVAVLFVVESIAGNTGVGFYIVNAWGRIDYATMFAGIIAMALMGVFLYEVINFVENRLVPWAPKPE
ncbi:MAG: ABC transporter permease [Coriobacteriia bacterium]|nr:ABC transporter permease [Coriobacteriia bacterium]MCL2870568.1 ABC transporter permease [Coriobacteriia bacterium]